MRLHLALPNPAGHQCAPVRRPPLPRLPLPRRMGLPIAAPRVSGCSPSPWELRGISVWSAGFSARISHSMPEPLAAVFVAQEAVALFQAEHVLSPLVVVLVPRGVFLPSGSPYSRWNVCA